MPSSNDPVRGPFGAPSSIYMDTTDALWGLDPSIKSSGIAVYLPQYDTYHVSRLETQDGDPTFLGAFQAALRQIDSIKACLSTWGRPKLVIQEYPPPSLIYSAGLYLVGATILKYLLYDCGLKVVLVDSYKIKSLLGVKKLDKEDTKKAVAEIAGLNPHSSFVDDGRNPVWKHILTDKADALLLLFYLAYNSGHNIQLPARYDSFKWLLKEETLGA